MKKTITVTAYNRPEYLRQALESLIRNSLDGWKIYFSIDPSEAREEILRVIQETLPAKVEREVITQSRRLGVSGNPFFILRKAFEEGSEMNIYLEEDIRVSPDITRLADWYSEFDLEHCLCLNLLHGNCGGDRNLSLPPKDLLIRTRNFNSLGFILTRDQWTSFFEPHWFEQSPASGKNSLIPVKEGWDWSILRYHLKRKTRLYTLQPLCARSNHIGRSGGTYCLPEFHDIVFSGIRLNEDPGPIRYRVASGLAASVWGVILRVCDMYKKIRRTKHSISNAYFKSSAIS